MPVRKRIAELKVERMKVADLQNAYHPKNTEIRNHPASGTPKWNALRRSLEHDYFDPIVLNKRNGFLVSGHLRLKIFTELKFTHVDVALVEYDEPTHLARMLAANRGMGDDIEDGQREFLEGLSEGEFDFALAGFTDEEASKLLSWPDDDDYKDYSNEAASKTRYELVIAVDSTKELEKLYDEMVERGLTCRILTL